MIMQCFVLFFNVLIIKYVDDSSEVSGGGGGGGGCTYLHSHSSNGRGYMNVSSQEEK